MTAPDGSGKLERTAFPEPTRHDQTEPPANAHLYRHIAYRVTNIDAVVAQARAAGDHTVGDVVEYQDSSRPAYIRGPEGLTIEVAEPPQSASTNSLLRMSAEGSLAEKASGGADRRLSVSNSAPVSSPGTELACAVAPKMNPWSSSSMYSVQVELRKLSDSGPAQLREGLGILAVLENA